MEKKKLIIEGVFRYTIEVDETDPIVKEYYQHGGMNELVQDLMAYRFANTLPVISTGGVEVKDIEVSRFNIIGNGKP